MLLPCNPVDGTHSSKKRLWPLLVAGLLIAMALIGPDVIKYLVLTISVICALIAAYWEVWRLGDGASPPPDICVRCGRGIIARIAMTRGGVRFYRCAICGARYQRKSRAGPWVDASGLEYDEMYSRHEPDGLGEAMAPPHTGSIDWARTVSVLRLNKQIRQITRDAGFRGTIKASFTPRWKAGAASHTEDRSGVWDSELDGLQENDMMDGS